MTFTGYDAVRQRITGIVTEANAGTEVPACPGWTVHDLVAHLAGGLADIVNGRMDLAGDPEWGERQVAERRGTPLDRLLAEWEANVPAAKDALDGRMGPIMQAEVVSHEHDIRGAVREPGARDDEIVTAAVQTFLLEVDRRVRKAGLPPLRVITIETDGPGTDTVVGEGEPAVTLRATPFDLMRTLSGRRTPEQLTAFDWDGDPTPYLDVFFVFGPAERPSTSSR